MKAKQMVCSVIGLGVLALFSAGLYDRVVHRFEDKSQFKSLKFLSTLEWTWYDFKFRNRKSTEASGIWVGKVDDAALQYFGRWPWSRGIYAEVLSFLYELGADVVGFDAVFTESEFQERYIKSALDTKVPFRQSTIKDSLKLSADQLDGIAKELPIIGDQIFASAILQYPRTVIGYFWQDYGECKIYDKDNPVHKKEIGENLDRRQASQLGLLHLDDLVDQLGRVQNQGIEVDGFAPIDLKGNNARVTVMHCPTSNKDVLSANAKRQGYFNAIADQDGLFRRAPLVLGFSPDLLPAKDDVRGFMPADWFKKATFFPSLALQVAASYFESPEIKVDAHKNSAGQLEISSVIIVKKDKSELKIETLPDGTIPVNFYGSQNSRPTPIKEFSLASISQFKNPDFLKEHNLPLIKPLQGNIVLIGPTALGVYDLRPNPVQGNAPGVYIHANTAARILERDQNPNSRASVQFASLGLSQTLLWVLGIVLTGFLAFSGAVQGVIVTLVINLLFLATDFLLFSKQSFALDGMTITTALLAVSITIFAYKYFTEEKERAFVKGAFEKYVSPDVVSDIMKDPKKLNLGGQKKELTVLFSDIRGFTTISERMGAAELAKFMNDYLSPMTDIVLENRGTIDKYMGDAIMAIFGAPIEYAEHPAKSVDAALGMMVKLEELKANWKSQGLPPIDIGIGINTGDMSVGNMGSSRIFSYTVMGDSVNLGSRLEGLNKEYGTHVIVSEFTRKFLGDAYLCRELDRVKVKGKQLPVTIFEVLMKGSDPLKKEIVQKFEEGLALYYKQDFEKAKAIFSAQAPEDRTSEIYLQRCELWMSDPPEADWDGSWTMKSK